MGCSETAPLAFTTQLPGGKRCIPGSLHTLRDAGGGSGKGVEERGGNRERERGGGERERERERGSM